MNKLTKKLAENIVKEIKKTAKATYTQKQLKQLVAEGKAIDITNYSISQLKQLQQKENGIYPIGSSYGMYGDNGRLYKGNKSGKIYAVTKRNTNLDYLPY